MSTTRVILGYSWRNDDKYDNIKTIENDSIGLDLSDYALKISETEEDSIIREKSLTDLKTWIENNPDLKNIRIDDNFLLRFLRTKKFRLHDTEQIILKYLNFRRTFSHMALNLDFLSSSVNPLISNGYIFVSPIRDKHGRRVVIVQAKYLNAKKHTSIDQTRAHILTYETLLEDPDNQVLGLVHIGDFCGVTLSAVTNWNPTEFARVIKWGEQSYPIRHKSIHLVNCPSTVKWIVDFVKGRISSKVKERVYAYTNYKELRKHIDAECLPLELGGRIPMKDMIESWKTELSAKREKLLELDNMIILSDKGIIRRRDKIHDNNPNEKRKLNHNNETDLVNGNFRKLNLD